MSTPDLNSQILKARVRLQRAEVASRDAEKRAITTRTESRRVKRKLKLMKRESKVARKAARKARKEFRSAELVCQEARAVMAALEHKIAQARTRTAKRKAAAHKRPVTQSRGRVQTPVETLRSSKPKPRHRSTVPTAKSASAPRTAVLRIEMPVVPRRSPAPATTETEFQTGDAEPRFGHQPQAGQKS